MIEIRRFLNDDLKNIKVQMEQRDEVSEACVCEKTAFTLCIDGKILGIIWTREVNIGRLEALAIISEDCGEKMIAFTRTVKRLIEEGMEKTGNVRIEMMVSANFVNGIRFAKLLGFEEEGTLKKVINGWDYKLFARIFE